MHLRHVGLTCSSEENADKFYRDLLGLKKSEPKTLSADLSRAIFNLDIELQLINYTDENIQSCLHGSDDVCHYRVILRGVEEQLHDLRFVLLLLAQ